jgi:hypothetical protein
MVQTVPEEFINAAIAEIEAVGYYRTDSRFELQIDDDTISLVSTSKIVPFNRTARISPPRVVAAKGLRSIEQAYHVNGSEVKAPFELGATASDHFCVRFRRRNDTVKHIADTHQWNSPVTAFKVTFKYGDTQKCGLDRLLMTRFGLTSRQIAADCTEYEYPSASLSGQGFSWFVDWLA